ncbi:hypothetical protein [Nonomuraea dietziae]|uniref:hypothetical protein n=1 Tax=Nonomuraea dietziae TaxID=65515 RepID=UPI0034079768
MADADVALSEGYITVLGKPVLQVPRKISTHRDEWLRHDAPAVYPSVPHGQARATLLFGILQDCGTAEGARPFDYELDQELRTKLPGDTEEKRTAVADAVLEKFWYQGQKVKYLLPLHASLALGFRQSSSNGKRMQYKMFRGNILPFLCSTSSGVDEDLLERLLDVFRSRADFTQLDREVLRIAESLSPNVSPLSVQTLLSSEGTRNMLEKLESAGGAFCQPSLELFQRDLAEVLSMRLPRRDLIEQVTLLLALHLATRLYRVSLVLANQLDQVISLFAPDEAPAPSACSQGCVGETSACDLAGRIRFRVGSGAFRAVKLTDACVESYRQLTSGYLVPLPVTIATANLAADALRAAEGPEIASLDLPRMHQVLNTGGELLARRFDAITRVIAVCRGFQQYPAAPADVLERFARNGSPGIYALRESLLEVRRSAMRHEGRDVVHQLVKEVSSGRLIQSNGTRATFFEIDEAMLFLLVRTICQRKIIPFAEFLEGLARYGLHPQDPYEEDFLQKSLERLGMFARYSDAAESAYVHHVDASQATGEG